MAGKKAKQDKAQEASKDVAWRINIYSAVAVYVQIENLVQFALAAGKLKPKAQLPSVRELSERLEVNPNTVAKAYRDLEVMGYLYTRRGMGVFIAEGAPGQAEKTIDKYIQGRLGEIAREAGAANYPLPAALLEIKTGVKAGASGEPIYT